MNFNSLSWLPVHCQLFVLVWQLSRLGGGGAGAASDSVCICEKHLVGLCSQSAYPSHSLFLLYTDK